MTAIVGITVSWANAATIKLDARARIESVDEAFAAGMGFSSPTRVSPLRRS
ncbi:hypothetical protein [Candidatus Viadribacter manganicus]|uniref:hypothetical protein n=1 Tax=Candidatus Viadribacter manganicus TaxID=1759059 RepID=UPI0012EAC9E7|nr:hypothetical protein [Candidatus Viadribacter manganicus]